MDHKQVLTFGSLEQNRDWKTFAASYGLQTAGLILLLNLAVVAPSVKVAQQKPLVYVPLVQQAEAVKAPPTPHIQPPPKVELAKLQPPQPKIEAPKPVEPPKVEAALKPIPVPEIKPQPVAPPPPKVEVGKFDTAPKIPTPNNPNKPIEVGAFNSGSSAPATVKAPVQQVQTGGFGDPMGAVANNNARDSKLTMAKVGSFDLPQGDGFGNGTGGNKGIKGTVASAGFGSGVAGSGEGDHGGPVRRVAVAGFGNMQAAAPSEARPKKVEQSPMTPVEILAKPNPVYTDEARKLHIEGEVLVEVTFTASGRVQVVRVVRGLGHGLDEAAISAAQKIQYKPAQRDGQPVDSNATLHIVFQLA